MGFRSNAAAAGAVAFANRVPSLREGWPFASHELVDLHMVRQLRTNLLVIGDSAASQAVLTLLRLDAAHPAVDWRPGQPLDLPAPSRLTTLILHDVHQLTCAAQMALLRWLDQSAVPVQIVATTPESLWPRVQAGAFNEVLYYRLNIVCLGATTPAES